MPSDLAAANLAPPRGWRLPRPRLGALPGSARLGLVLLLIVLAGTLLAPWLTSADPAALGTDMLAPPSAEAPFGTDDLGRDAFARVLYGGRISLLVGLVSALISVVLGVTIGMVAGFFGGAIDEALMRVSEVFQILPKLLVAVVVVAMIGSGVTNEVLVIGLLSWPATARVIRGRVQVLRHEEFIAAAAMSGASRPRILWRHILPNILPYFVVSASLQVAGAVLSESFLSFLGLGDADHPSWGYLLQQGQLYIADAWWLTTFPGIALAMLILGLNLIGDGLGGRAGRRP
jgi:peptide/nickel transport system permease protein